MQKRAARFRDGRKASFAVNETDEYAVGAALP